MCTESLASGAGTPLSNPQYPEVHVALPSAVLKSAVAAMLKYDKFEVTEAELAGDGEGITFNAKSKSGQVRITGIFSDPQRKLELEEPQPDDLEHPGANEVANDDDEPDDGTH